ncbi:ComEC/Rec2 family competence protein [Radicibacter daui]|uniref:ComEC/Rec2 family competence protein n=1 Tax=Radicibacter daui TaxID=3064829 RepID=UPI00404691B9
MSSLRPREFPTFSLRGRWPGIRLRLLALSAGRLFQGERERLILWTPVFLGWGAATYLGLPVEPTALQWLLVSIAALTLLCGLFLSLRFMPAGGSRTFVLFGLAMALLFGGGFGLCGLRATLLAAPRLAEAMNYVRVEGVLADVRPAEGGRRLVLTATVIEHLTAGQTPARISLLLPGTPREGENLRPGLRVALRAFLAPPGEAVLPGDYSFARRAWFQGIGAVGRALPGVEVLGEDGAGWQTDLRDLQRRIVSAIDVHLKAAMSPAAAGVAASALLGERSSLPEADLEAIRASGLAHLLSISGLHMSLVIAAVFMVVRGGLALIPAITLRLPAKKVAAFVSCGVSFGFLLLVDAPLPAVRSFLMALVMLIAMLAERDPFSMRVVATAATLQLLFAPESVGEVGFQMSFAAVAALIAFAEALKGWRPGWAEQLGWITGALAAVIMLGLVSLVATAATLPFSLYSFNQFVSWGFLANLIGVPLFELIIMPLGLLALILEPVGASYPVWWLAGQGIDLLLALAHWVAGWPAAALMVPAPSTAGFAVAVLSGLWLLIWTRRWRWLGAPLALAGLLSLFWQPQPVLIAATGDNGRLAFAYRDPDGMLWLSGVRRNSYVGSRWSQRFGQGEAGLLSSGLRRSVTGIACDGLGCSLDRDGLWLSLIKTADALPEECGQGGALLVAPGLYLPPACRAQGNRGHAEFLVSGTTVFYAGSEGWFIRQVFPYGRRRLWDREPAGSENKTPAAAEEDAAGDDDDRRFDDTGWAGDQ